MPINSVNTNVGALVALQSLNKTNSELDNIQKRVSTGLKVADAVDDGASFSIAQGLRSDLKAYEAINEQIGKAKGVANVALGAATRISDKLADVEEVLIKLADEAVTGTQRDQYATDYASLKTEISNFISEASFNGFNLINDTTTAGLNTIRNTSGDQISVNSFDLASDISSQLTAVTTASDAQTLIAASGSFRTAETNIADTLSTLGGDIRSLDSQQEFISVLSDATEVGIGDIVDADLAKESARLQSLQIRQQLGTQSLGIANSAPAILLGLFG